MGVIEQLLGICEKIVVDCEFSYVDKIKMG